MFDPMRNNGSTAAEIPQASVVEGAQNTSNQQNEVHSFHQSYGGARSTRVRRRRQRRSALVGRSHKELSVASNRQLEKYKKWRSDYQDQARRSLSEAFVAARVYNYDYNSMEDVIDGFSEQEGDADEGEVEYSSDRSCLLSSSSSLRSMSQNTRPHPFPEGAKYPPGCNVSFYCPTKRIIVPGIIMSVSIDYDTEEPCYDVLGGNNSVYNGILQSFLEYGVGCPVCCVVSTRGICRPEKGVVEHCMRDINAHRKSKRELSYMYFVRVANCESPQKIMGVNVRYGAPDEQQGSNNLTRVNLCVRSQAEKDLFLRRATPSGAGLVAEEQSETEQFINRGATSLLEQSTTTEKGVDVAAEIPSHHSHNEIGHRTLSTAKTMIPTRKLHQLDFSRESLSIRFSDIEDTDLGAVKKSCALKANKVCRQKSGVATAKLANVVADSSSSVYTETIRGDHEVQTKVVTETLKFPSYISRVTVESITKDAVMHQLISRLQESLSVCIEISSDSTIVIKSKGSFRGDVKVKEAKDTIKAAIIGTMTSPHERYLLRERWREHARESSFQGPIKVPRSSDVRPDLLMKSLIGTGSFDFDEILEKKHCWLVIDDESDNATVHGNDENDVKNAAFLLRTEMYTAYKVLCEERKEKVAAKTNVIVASEPNILPTYAYSHEEYLTFPVWLSETLVQKAVANADVQDSIRCFNQGDNFIQIDYLSSKRRFSVKSKFETDSNNTCSQLKNLITHTLPSLVHRRLLIESWGLDRCMKFKREIQLPLDLDNCAIFMERFIDSSSFDCFRLDQYMDKMHCHVSVDDVCTLFTITGNKEVHIMEASEFLNKRLDYLLTALGYGVSRLKSIISTNDLSNHGDRLEKGPEGDRNIVMKNESTNIKETCSASIRDNDKLPAHADIDRSSTKLFKFPSWIGKSLIDEFTKSEYVKSTMKRCNEKDGCNIRISVDKSIPYFVIETNSDDIARDSVKEVIQIITKLGVSRSFQRVLQESWMETTYLYLQQISVYTYTNMSKESVIRLLIESDGFSLDQFMDSYACSVTIGDGCDLISVKGNNQEKVKVACNTLRNRLFLVKTSLQQTTSDSIITANSKKCKTFDDSKGCSDSVKDLSDGAGVKKEQNVDLASSKSLKGGSKISQSEQTKLLPRNLAAEAQKNKSGFIFTSITSYSDLDDPSVFRINIPCWIGEKQQRRTYIASPSFQDVVQRFRAKRLEINSSPATVRVKGSPEQLLKEAEVNLRQSIINMVEFQPLKSLFRDSWSKTDFKFVGVRNIAGIKVDARSKIIKDFSVQLRRYIKNHPSVGNILVAQIDDKCHYLRVCSNVEKAMKIGLHALNKIMKTSIQGVSSDKSSSSLSKDRDNGLKQNQVKSDDGTQEYKGVKEKDQRNDGGIPLNQSKDDTNKKGRWGPRISRFDIDSSNYSKPKSNKDVIDSLNSARSRKPDKKRGRSQSHARIDADNNYQQSYLKSKKQRTTSNAKEEDKASAVNNADIRRCRSQSRARFVDNVSQSSIGGNESKTTSNLREVEPFNKTPNNTQHALRKRGRSQSQAQFEVDVQMDQNRNMASCTIGRSQSRAWFDVDIDKHRADEDRRSRGRSQSRARFDVDIDKHRADEKRRSRGRSQSRARFDVDIDQYKANEDIHSRGRSQSRARFDVDIDKHRADEKRRIRGRSQSRARFDVDIDQYKANKDRRSRGRSQNRTRFDVDIDKYRADENRRSRGRSQSRARFDVDINKYTADEDRRSRGRSQNRARFDVDIDNFRADEKRRNRGRSQSRARFDVDIDKYRADEDIRSRRRSQSRARFDVDIDKCRTDEYGRRDIGGQSISRSARSQSRARGRSQSRPRQSRHAIEITTNTNKK